MNRDQLKVSRYATRVDLESADATLLYGGLFGRLVEVRGDQREVASRLLEDPNVNLPEAAELRRELVDQAILVPAAWDELELVEQRRLHAKTVVRGSLQLTVCPTVNCNYRCVYCYQKHVGRLMPEEVQDALDAFLDAQTPAVDELRITWFGGEPLLGLDRVIEPLTERFRARVGERYSARMISNGWLLTPQVSERLVELGVESVQVTLDGPRAVHDERRPLAGGGGTFDRILANLRGCHPDLGIALRVNTDHRNADRAGELLDQLAQAGLAGRVFVYFAPVTVYTEVCADTAGHCIAGRDWSALSARLRLAAMERGFSDTSLPESKTGVCIADNPRGWVVTPDGLLFKCWNDVTTPGKAVGSLLGVATGPEQERMAAELERWTSWSPFELPECRGCKALPQCQSGCAHLAMQQPAPITHGDCTELKWNLPETVATFYLSHRRREVSKRIREASQEATGA